MEENGDWRPQGAQLLTAYLTVPSVDEAMEFYSKAFGFTKGEGMEGPGGDLLHGSMMYRGDHLFMMGSEKAEWTDKESPVTSGEGSPVGLYLYTPDVDAMFKRAIDAGAEQVMELHDEFWGDRIGAVRDPIGYEWTLASKVGEFDPSKMPKFD